MNISVIGAGAWGTAIAIVLGRKGSHRVRLWVYEKEVVDSITNKRTNDLFLPNAPIPERVEPTNSFEEALENAEIVVSVMPSHHTRRLFTQMAPHLTREMRFVSATKGVENDSLLRMTEVIAEVVGQADIKIGALSGPSFAKEVSRGDPTAITFASQDKDFASTVQREFSEPSFRVYTNDDMVGVELGGRRIIKNDNAAGGCDGLGLGHHT